MYETEFKSDFLKMADAEARREARRRKILQNSEKRMNILFGKSKEDKNSEVVTNTETPNGPELQEPVKKQDVDSFKCDDHRSNTSDKGKPDLKEHQLIENTTTIASQNVTSSLHTHQSPDRVFSPTDTDSVRHRVTRNTVKIQQTASHTSTENTDQGTETSAPSSPSVLRSPQQQFDLLRAISCVFIAILSRVVLQLGIGLLYFQTVILPFAALQVQLYYYRKSHNKFQMIQNSHKGSVMSAALMLCGIKPELIATYNSIMGNVMAVFEDLGIYLFAFFFSNMLMKNETSS